jgi:hypothetical protein
MKTASHFCLLAMLCCLISGMVNPSLAGDPATFQPEYKGQSVRQWIRDLTFEVISKDGLTSEIEYPERAEIPADVERYRAFMKKYRDEAKYAFKALRMQALPTILELLKTPGSVTDRTEFKFPDLAHGSLRVETSPRVYRGQAIHALRHLLPASVTEGKMIVYELEQILTTPDLDPGVKEAVRYCLTIVLPAQSQVAQ